MSKCAKDKKIEPLEFIANNSPSARKRQGYTVEREIMNSLGALKSKGYKLEHYKLVDTSMYDYYLYCPNCMHRWKSPFISKKALGDIVVISFTGTYYIEAKSSKQPKFPTTNIKSDQFKIALKISYYQHRKYWFFICDRRKRAHYKLYAILPSTLDKAIDKYGNNLDWNTLEETAEYTINRAKKMMWDLEEWFIKEVEQK